MLWSCLLALVLQQSKHIPTTEYHENTKQSVSRRKSIKKLLKDTEKINQGKIIFMSARK